MTTTLPKPAAAENLQRAAMQPAAQFETFALTDDHDRQLAVWNAVKGGYHIHP